MNRGPFDSHKCQARTAFMQHC